MKPPIWHWGGLDDLPDIGEAPLAWHVQLDDPAMVALARQAPLSPADLVDLANRPQAGLRVLRRQLTKVLLARVAGIHPDTIVLRRSEAGGLVVVEPAGWHVSVAGRWPYCLIGIARAALGVDIEPYNAEPPPGDAFTPEEFARLGKAPGWALLRRWTAKEAHAKAFGIASQIDAADMETQAAGILVQTRSAIGQTVCHFNTDRDRICALAQPFNGEVMDLVA